MTISEFKEKYFTNSFYWVSDKNYKELQEIGIALGCVNSSKQSEIIGWHKGFTNLGFRTYEHNDNITVFQKECFLCGHEDAADYEEMIRQFNLLR